MNIFSKILTDILLFLNLKFHNIYMVFTRSQLKHMSITSEMSEYFENLMKTLVTNETLEQQLKFFQDGQMKKIEDKFKQQNDRIEELESKLAIKQKIIDHLEITCDDNEQYSQRSCLRIHGLDFSSDEDEGVLKKVEKGYSDMGIEFNQIEIDRSHYIGKPYMDKKKNKV